MFVQRLIEEIWEGVSKRSIAQDAPTSAAITAAIQRLDGKNRNLVSLQGPGEAYLLVGGGNGKYVVTGSKDAVDIATLLAPTDPGGTVPLVAGGQEGDYPSRQVVDQERAVQAACCFAKDGDFDPELDWEVT